MAYDDTTAFLQSLATQAMQNAANNASRIYSLPPRSGLREPKIDVDLTKPNMGPPPSFGNLFGTSDTAPILGYLNGQAEEWGKEYFPQLSTGLKTVPDELLVNIISGVKPFGYDATYFELVWHQARDRAYRTRNSEVQQIASDFSARGFKLPPGAMVGAITAAEQRASDSILEVNREQALKDADVRLDLLKFAESEALQYKLGILSALGNFYQQWISVSDRDLKAGQIRAQAQSSLYGALASYYDVEMSFQKLLLEREKSKADALLQADTNRLRQQANYSAVTGALGQSVNAFADIAGSAAQAGGSLSAEITNL